MIPDDTTCQSTLPARPCSPTLHGYYVIVGSFVFVILCEIVLQHVLDRLLTGQQGWSEKAREVRTDKLKIARGVNVLLAFVAQLEERVALPGLFGVLSV